MKNNLMLFFFYFLIWSALNWPLTVFNTICGLVVSLVIVLILGDVFVANPYLGKSPRRYGWVLIYIGVLAWETVRAALNNCLLLIRPELNVRPGIVKVKTTLKTDTAISLLATSITLSMGTCVVDVDSGRGILYVHWIDVLSDTESESTSIIVKRFEKILKNIFE